MNLESLFNFGKDGNYLDSNKDLEEPLVMVPANDLIKLQKGYIEYLESKEEKSSTHKELEEITRKIEKMGRDSAMRLADTIREALATKNYRALEDLEKHIRKQAFGQCDSDRI